MSFRNFNPTVEVSLILRNIIIILHFPSAFLVLNYIQSPFYHKTITMGSYTVTCIHIYFKLYTVLSGRMEKPESGIRNRSQSRKRKQKWNRNRNPNPNLRNKTWRRFCLKSVTNNYCSIKTFHPHIIFIYCYYIFYCRIFCVRRKIFLQEFHIRLSIVTWDHD